MEPRYTKYKASAGTTLSQNIRQRAGVTVPTTRPATETWRLKNLFSFFNNKKKTQTQEHNPIEKLSQYLQPNHIDHNAVDDIDAIISYVKLESLTEQNMKLINELFTNPPTTTGTLIPIKAKVLLKLLGKISELSSELNKTRSTYETNLIKSYPELKNSAEYEDYLNQIPIMNTPTSGDQMGGARRFTQNGNRLHRKGATRKSRNVAKPRLP